MSEVIEDEITHIIMQHLRHPFEWGKWDCATLWHACVKATTGKDLLEGAKPWYSEASAYRCLLRLGYATQEDIFRTHAVRVDREQVRRGDLAFATSTLPIAGPAVCLGNGLMVSRNPDGFLTVPIENAETFYRVE